MRTQHLRMVGAIGLGMMGAIGLSMPPAIAQLRPIADTTPQGNLGTIVLPSNNPRVDLIDGGTRPQNGANLFHSFSTFSIDVGRGAYFLNPPGVKNILSRVTGGSFSDIQGTIGVLGSANLSYQSGHCVREPDRINGIDRKKG
jgi:filamentous hemagglutinin family protein